MRVPHWRAFAEANHLVQDQMSFLDPSSMEASYLACLLLLSQLQGAIFTFNNQADMPQLEIYFQVFG